MDNLLTVGEVTAVVVAVLLCGAAFAIAYGIAYSRADKNTVVVPCHVGDTIYMPWEFDGCDGIAILHVEHIVVNKSGVYAVTDLEDDDLDYFEKYCWGRFSADEFGKIVFGTYKEAERAQTGGAKQ